jgi:Na+/proline symporter
LPFALAATFGLAVYVHERRQDRPAMIVRMALVLVAIRAIVGISSGSASAYLAQEIGIDALIGSVVLASLATARPFASWFASEIYPFPDEARVADAEHRPLCAGDRANGRSFPDRGTGLVGVLHRHQISP